MKDLIQNNGSASEKKNKRNGLITTSVVHAIVLLIFLFWGLRSAFPPPVEGILINFGTMETGMGDTPSKIEEEPKEITPVQESEPMPVVETQEAPDEIMTQDMEEAFAIPETKEVKEEPKKEPEKKKEEVKKEPVKEEPKKETVKEPVKEPVKEEPKVDPKSLYTGQKSDENSPSNEGKTYTPGDQGDPGGDPSSKNYEGDNYGLGNIGVGYDLTGRSLVAIPPIKAKDNETGKIVVSIKVDRNGQVVFAKYTVKGSTTSDPSLIAMAEKAAREAKFSSSPNAPEEQFGSITFTFKAR